MLCFTSKRRSVLLFAMLLCASSYSRSQARGGNVRQLLEASRACSGDLCRFSALQQALKLEPHNIQVNLAFAHYYLNRGQSDRARSALESVLAVAPANAEARLELAKLDVKSGQLNRALTTYRKLEQEFSTDGSLLSQVTAGYEQLGLLSDAKRLVSSALSRSPANAEVQIAAIRLAEKTRDVPMLRNVYARILAVQPDNTLLIAKLANAELNAGMRSSAERRLRETLSRFKGDATLKQSLAQLHGEMPSVTDPESARLHKAWVTGNFAAPEDEDNQYLARVQDEIKRALALKLEGADSALLSDVRIDRVQPNGLYSSRVQRLFYIATDAGASSYSTRSIQYSPASESLTILRARLHKPDGRVVEADDEGDDRVADKKAGMYYDVRARRLRFPSVAAGDVLELDYRTAPTTDENPYGEYFANLQLFRTNVPEQIKRYVVVVPSDRAYYVRERSVQTARITTSGDQRTYLWEERNLEALPNEPLAPAATEFAPYVHISSLRDFNQLGKWYAQLLAPQLQLNSELQQVAENIARVNPDIRDRVNAVYQFVLNNTRYVGMEFGVYSYKPYPVSDVYARRFGDCKDKASLMIALLRTAGVDANMALVRTRSMGPISADAASIALFNHAIVYVPSLNLWLDGTADYFAMGELPSDDQGAMALTVAADGASALRTIPVSAASDNVTIRKVLATLQPDGTIRFQGTSQSRGESAPALRRDYEATERQRESVRKALADVFPSVELDNVRVGTLDQGVDVAFNGATNNFAGYKTIILRNSWMPREYVSKLASQSSRTQDVVVGTPWMTVEDFSIELPKGARVVHIPSDIAFSTPFGSVSVGYRLQGSQLTISSTVEIKATRIAAHDYAAFRDFCTSLDQAFREELQVVLR